MITYKKSYAMKRRVDKMNSLQRASVAEKEQEFFIEPSL